MSIKLRKKFKSAGPETSAHIGCPSAVMAGCLRPAASSIYGPDNSNSRQSCGSPEGFRKFSLSQSLSLGTVLVSQRLLLIVFRSDTALRFGASNKPSPVQISHLLRFCGPEK